MAAARALLGMSQVELAELANVPRSSIARYEAGRTDLRTSTFDAIIRVLTEQGVVFIMPDAEVSAGVMLRRTSESAGEQHVVE